ncbi:MAG: hypothetical protein V4753_06585 [Pseudomonadota bacterium]
MFRPFALVVLFLSALVLTPPHRSAAQDAQVWLQVEADSDHDTALDRARAYAALFPETAGLAPGTGWCGVVLGPSPADETPAGLAL